MQAFHRLLWFIGLILLQVLVLNHVHFGEYASPFLYTYFFFIQRANVSRAELLMWGFSMGLIVDIFSNTPGLNASATTVLALIRNPLLTSQSPRDAAEDFLPSIRTMGFVSFFRYVLVGVFLHIAVLQLIDSFSFSRPVSMLYRVVSDTALSVACMICIDFIRRAK